MHNFFSFALLTGLLLAAPCAHAGAAAVRFAPHEAVYKLQLEQSRQSSQVMSANGSLRFVLNDACDGWTTDQKLELRFTYIQGQSNLVAVSSSAWESKDGKHYTFTSRTLNNGAQTEIFRGSATLDEKGGEAIYTLPKHRQLKLAAGTIFPTQHSQLILAGAMSGQKVANHIVFDGTDEEPRNDISVFLGKAQSLDKEPSIAGSLRDNPLLQGLAYPTQLAFFAQPEADMKKEAGEAEETGVPDYELRLDLLPNGVARRLLIDYGDFSIGGTLTSLKALPDQGCSGAP